MEAARSLGMPSWYSNENYYFTTSISYVWFHLLGNELIALLKDSSLVMVIAVNDLLYAGKVVAGASFRTWEPYLTIAIIYLILTYIFGKVITYVEKRFSNSYVPSSRKRIFSIWSSVRR